MKKKILAVIFLIIIILESSIIYIKERTCSVEDEKNKIEEKEYVNKEKPVTIIDILDDFDNNSSISLMNIDDKTDIYEVNVKISGNKDKFIEAMNNLKGFEIIDYSINLEKDNIQGIFKLQCKK